MDTGFVRQFVDYCQYQVRSAPYWRTGMHIHLVGDELLHVGSPTECTGFAATHTGWIQLRVIVLDGPPEPAGDDWEAISEMTLWSPHGRLSVHSMMGSTTDELSAIAVPAGLVRVRAHARNRVHESVRTDTDPPEQHELLVWPVAEDVGPRTLRAGPTRREREIKTDQAAEYAMLDVIRPYDKHEELDPDLPRVSVRRRGQLPPPGRLPVGAFAVELTRIDDDTLEWRWVPEDGFPPDDRPSIVRREGAEICHRGLTGRHAIMLGLVWDHLLSKDPDAPPAWEPVLQARAAEQREQDERRRRQAAEREARDWGGTPPTDTLRAAGGDARSLARMDRPLLDRLDALPPARQREVARRAGRFPSAVAGVPGVAGAGRRESAAGRCRHGADRCSRARKGRLSCAAGRSPSRLRGRGQAFSGSAVRAPSYCSAIREAESTRAGDRRPAAW